MRCSALVHSARRTAIAPRAARSERLERHESEVHTRNAGRATAQRDESPPCLLRSCDARSEPAPCSSQFTMLTLARRRLRLADPQNKVGRGEPPRLLAGFGPQAANAASRCGALEPPSPHAPSKTLSEQTLSREKLCGACELPDGAGWRLQPDHCLRAPRLSQYSAVSSPQ